MRFNSIFVIIFFLVSMFSVSANLICKDEFCSNEWYNGKPLMTMQGSSFESYGSSFNITSCIHDTSLYNPIAYDIDSDLNTEIITVQSSTKINFYGATCNVKKSIVSNYPIVAPPRLTDPLLNGIYKLTVLTNTTLDVYYSNGTLYSSLNYLANTSNTSLTSLACTDWICWARINNDRTMYVFNMLSTPSMSYKVANSFPVTYIRQVDTAYGGSAQTIDTGVYATFCNWAAADQNVACSIFNISGNAIATVTLTDTAALNVINMHNYEAGFVNMGSSNSPLYRFIANAHYQKTGAVERQMGLIYDGTVSTVLYRICQNPSNGCGSGVYGQLAYTSDVVVSDYDKDSVVEACMIREDSAGIDRFLCYTSDFYTPKYNFTINRSAVGLSTFPYTFSLTNFNTSSTYMYFVNKEGVFDINPISSRQIYDTGYAAVLATDNKGISVFDTNLFLTAPNFAWAGNPIYDYSDSTMGLTIGRGLTSSVCGDGFCYGSEDIVTCPQDCAVGGINATSNGSCLNDAQCPTLYPKCIANLCVSGFSPSLICVDDSYCPINASLCINNYCVAGVWSGYGMGNTTNNTGTYTDIGKSIDMMFSQLTAGSVLLRFIIGLALLLYLTFEINRKYNPTGTSAGVLYITFGVLLVMFTFLGLINKWIIWSIVLVTATMLILGFVLKFKTSEG